MHVHKCNKGGTKQYSKSNNKQWIMYQLGIQEKWIYFLALALVSSVNLVESSPFNVVVKRCKMVTDTFLKPFERSIKYKSNICI